MKEITLKKIFGVLLMVAFLVLTIMYVKRLPPLMKIMMLAVDVFVYYACINILIKPKKEKE